jgi:hypothetical protein
MLHQSRSMVNPYLVIEGGFCRIEIWKISLNLTVFGVTAATLEALKACE